MATRRRGSKRIAGSLCFCLLLQLGQSLSSSAFVRDGKEFVDAVVAGASEILVDWPYLDLNDAHWEAAGYAQASLLLTSNATVRGSPRLAYPPVVKFNCSRKVKLASYVTLTLERIVATNLALGRKWQQANALGADIMAPSDPSTVGARSVMRDVMVLAPACPPSQFAWPYLSSITRPGGGTNTMDLVLSQPGCVNSTSFVNGSVVPPAQRCWAYRVANTDIEAEAMNTDRDDDVRDANYVTALQNATLLCVSMFTYECLGRLGPQGCVDAIAAQTPIDWFDQFRADVDAALAREAAASTKPSQPPPNAQWDTQNGGPPQLQPAADQGGSGDSGSATVAVAAGVAAGVAVACALALGIFVWWRRRHRKAAAGGAPADASTFAKIMLTTDPASSLATPYRAENDPDAAEGVYGKGGGNSGLRTGSSLPAELSGYPSACGTPSPGTALLLLEDAGTSPEDSGRSVLASTRRGAPLPGAPRAPAALRLAEGVITESTPYRGGLKTAFQLQMPGAEAGASEKGRSRQPAEGGGSSAPIPIVRLTPQVLGKGGFGRVFAGEMGDQPVAVKLIAEDLDKLPSSEAAMVAKSFEQELEVLARCTHPCIVRVLAACAKPPRPCIVMERMETSLERMLYGKTDTLLPLPVVIHIALEVARGLEYLHPTVLHRDLKPGNVLVNNPNSPKPVVKITDFGLSRLRDTILRTSYPEAGTPAYLAPECFDVEAVGITYHADIYAWGVLVWETLAGMQPWLGLAPVNIAVHVHVYNSRLPMPPETGSGRSADRWPRRLMRLLSECWDKDPLRRPAAAELVKRLLVIQQDLERLLPAPVQDQCAAEAPAHCVQAGPSAAPTVNAASHALHPPELDADATAATTGTFEDGREPAPVEEAVAMAAGSTAGTAAGHGSGAGGPDSPARQATAAALALAEAMAATGMAAAAAAAADLQT